MSEVRELPSGWTWAEISDVSLPGDTWNPRTSKVETFSYIDIEAVDNKQQRIVAPKKLLPAQAPSRARVAVQAGDVLFSLVRPYLKNIAVVPKELDGQVASTAFLAVRPAKGVDSSFIFYQLLQDSFINSIPTYGNSPPAARDDEFIRLKISLAPSDEQTRISGKIDELLSDLDAGVAALERARAKLKRYRAAVLKAAVEGRLTAEWRKANPAAEPADKLLERILAERRRKWEAAQLAKFAAAGKTPPKGWKDKYPEPATPDTTSLPELPEGWCWATMEQIGEVQLGRQRSPKNRSKDYPTKYLRAANITEMGLDLSDVLDMEFKPNEKQNYLLRDGDLILSEASGSPNQVGKPAIWRKELDECCFQNTVIRLRSVVVDLNVYLLNVLRAYYINGVFAKTATGVGINHLSAYKFAKLPLPIAPLMEQAEVVSQIEAVFSTIAYSELGIERSRERATRLRQSILKRAFEGKLVPQDPNDEPASVLLERIRGARAAQNPPRARKRRHAPA